MARGKTRKKKKKKAGAEKKEANRIKLIKFILITIHFILVPCQMLC